MRIHSKDLEVKGIWTVVVSLGGAEQFVFINITEFLRFASPIRRKALLTVQKHKINVAALYSYVHFSSYRIFFLAFLREMFKRMNGFSQFCIVQTCSILKLFLARGCYIIWNSSQWGISWRVQKNHIISKSTHIALYFTVRWPIHLVVISSWCKSSFHLTLA